MMQERTVMIKSLRQGDSLKAAPFTINAVVGVCLVPYYEKCTLPMFSDNNNNNLCV